MHLDKGLHEEDSDDDKDDPCLIFWLISLQVQYNNDLPYVRKYLLFHRALYTEKMDIQFTLYERSTSDYPVTPISPSTALFVDHSFESPLPANLSSHDVNHLDSSLENTGSSDNFFGDIITPTINWNNYLDPNVNEDELIEDDLKMDEFLDSVYAAFGLPSVLSTISSSSFSVLVSYDDTSLIFLSDSDDEFSDSDDESSFLPFDDETLLYYETEWIELFFRSVCFSFIPLYLRPPFINLDLTEISSKQLPASLPPLSFLDLRVTHGRWLFWKLFVRFSGFGAVLVPPSFSSADFKFYDRLYRLHPSIYDQIARFTCLFEIYAGLF
ncbi:4547_t:CDS:2, partial [Rhizophagus irregularis]